MTDQDSVGVTAAIDYSIPPGLVPDVVRSRLDYARPPDVTLVNLNLMLAKSDGTFDQQVYLPLGLLYMAAVLGRAGHNPEFIDYQLFTHARLFDESLFVQALGEVAPLVCISCMSNLLPFAVAVSRELKQRHPECRIALGGVGPSPVAHLLVNTFPFIDHVVEGEGEVQILDLVAGRAARVPKVAVPEDLNELPLPAYQLIDFSLYDASPSIITSRGCPYQCTFCTEPYNFSGKVRFRSVESILEELELVHALSGRRMFLFQDDILPLKPSRFHRLLDGMMNLSFPIEWKCFSRVDLMDEELMHKMVRAGCKQIRYGIESGCNRTLERIRKEFTIEKAYEVAARSAQLFPSVHCSFIWGYPFETLEDFEETLQWVERFEAAGVSVLLFEFSPLPGSPLYRETNMPLTFAKDRYSIYVLTGHEVVTGGKEHRTDARHQGIYQMIQDNPAIFSGFYEYDNRGLLDLRRRFAYFNTQRRSRVKNEYDL